METFMTFIAHAEDLGVVYPFLFVIAFFESLVVAGFAFPGTAIMAFLGYLSAGGAFPLWLLILVSTVGGVVGDVTSFLLGKYQKQRILSIAFVKRKTDAPAIHRFIERHGAASVIFGRFIGPIRPLLPFFTGVVGMSTTTFVLFDIVGAAIWYTFYASIGFVFSHAFASVERWSLTIGLLLLLILIIIYRLRKKHQKAA